MLSFRFQNNFHEFDYIYVFKIRMETTVQQKQAMPPPVAPLKKEPPQILYGKLSNFLIEKKVSTLQY